MVKFKKYFKYIFPIIAAIIIAVVVIVVVVAKSTDKNNNAIYLHEKIVINYGENLNRIQLMAQNIEVVDNKGNKVNVGVNFYEDSKNVVIVTPPDKGYETGKSYNLHITTNISFNINNKVNDVKQWYFKVKNDENIKFADANLELAIRRQINKPKGQIYLGEVYKLGSLNADSYNIKNLEGIEKLTSLKTLSLSGNKITNIEGLKNLKQLKILSIANNKISNIAPLKGLKGLTTLWLIGNEIKDYSTVKAYYKNLTAKDFKLD